MGIVVVRGFRVTVAAQTALDYLRDFGNTAAWAPFTRSVTRSGSGPIGVGSAWHTEARVLGVTTLLTYTLCEATADRVIFLGRNEGATSTGTVTVRPVADHTEVTYHVDLELHGVAKLAAPLLRIELRKVADDTAARLAGMLNRLAEAT